MHQPSWSYASSITQPSWLWSYEHGKSYTRWLHHTPINTRKDYHVSTLMIIRIKHNPTILALVLWAWKELHKMVTSHRSKHEKIIMYQPSWSYESNITQPSWHWSYQHGKTYARWLHHTPIKTRKDYLASTFLIIRIKHNPTILALELSTWKELHKMVTSHTDQYTKILSCINLHDHTRQAKSNHLGAGVINMERATQVGYITHRSIHEKIITHQPSRSYAASITQPPWRWSYQHGKSYARWLHHTPIKLEKIIMYQPSWSYASSITQPSWRWSYQHGKSYTR